MFHTNISLYNNNNTIAVIAHTTNTGKTVNKKTVNTGKYGYCYWSVLLLLGQQYNKNNDTVIVIVDQYFKKLFTVTVNAGA